MVNNDADSVNCSTTQIRDEDEKVETSKSKKSDSASPGPETVVSSSRKSSLDVEKNSDTSVGCAEELESSSSATKTSLFCSVPLNKIRSVLSYGNSKAVEDESSLAKIKQVASRKLLCLYCDRTFVSTNLRQKHVERCHSEKQSRRLSSRKLQSQFTTTACFHCDKLPVEHSLTQLFEHLVTEHSQKYFGCLSCEERFLSQSLLSDHNAKYHASPQKRQKSTSVLKIQKEVNKDEETKETTNINEEDKGISQKLTRSMAREKTKPPQNKSSLRQLRSKKIAIKASKIGLKRSKRLRATQTKVPVRKKKRTKVVETTKLEETTTKTTEKAKANSINPYPEFDNYYRVKKITDHSIDNLKISSLTFDDVFDKAFFNRIKCNIQENLMFHLDGKLFKNEESESRISNFEKNPPTQDVPSTSSENFGCDLSLNAITPVTSILTPNFGEDLESQIEYGSKPSKKKLQTRQDPVRHKYVTRRKYQASILEHKENRDLSKLDMWTQLVIKDRQQKVMNDQKSAKEMLEYTTCAEYKLKVQRTELNRILDRRGPFEDLQEEASKKAALDKLNSETSGKVSEECFKEVRLVMETLLNEVVRICAEQEEESTKLEESESLIDKVNIPALPDYLQLRRTSAVPSEEIDKSDKIVLICSSQETENYELPTNKARAKNEMVELSGEWARSRIYVCAACGLKLPNMKLLLEHKSLYHQNAWVQHYELVGNQSELYRHLCIPGLGKVGHVEDTVQCKLWRRSDARVCSKCGKMCNALAELHRHILECGGDWTWMLARKKCKHRPFGSRKKRRGLVKRIRERINNQKTEQTEKKKYKKTFEGPRQRPSDADTIQRMLANLPPKRSSRKSICMKDGFPRNRNNKQNNKKKVMKCGKIVMQKSTYKTTQSKTKEASNNLKNASVKKTMRNLSRTLSSKILDTSSKLRVKRQLIKNINRRSTRRSAIEAAEISNDIIKDEEVDESNLNNTKKNINVGKSKNQNTNRVKNILKEKINIKNFFPVSKRKSNKNVAKNTSDSSHSDENKGTKPEINKTTKNVVKKLIKKSLNFRTVNKNKNIVEKTEPVVMIEKLPQSEVRKEKQTPTTSKLSNKRKLRSSFRKVIDRVKKLKLDNPGSSAPIEPAKDMNVRTLNSFLGQGTKEKEQLATVLVPLVEEPKENPPSTPAFVQNAMDNNSPTEESLIPENIFNLDHNSENLLQAKSPLETSTDEIKKNETKNLFETITEMKDCKITEDYPKETKESETEVGITVEITKTEEVVESLRSTSPAPNVTENSKEMSLLSIETSSKSDKSPLLSPVLSPSMLSPKMKGKLRKPNRGLNDCIAMLTKKAFEETHKEESAKPIEGAPVEDNKNIAHKFVRENECILKIPVFQGEKQKYLQDEVLDLSKPKKDLKMKIPSSKSDAPDLSNLTYPQFWNSVVQTNTESIHSNNSITKEEPTKFWNPMNNSIRTIIPKVISEKAILKIPKIVESSWNSVDDIIQKVVENSCESSVIKTKIPLESKISSELLNSIDKIIEEVVKGDLETNTKEGRNENFNCMIEKASPDLIEDKMSKQKSKKITRKIKFAKQKCFEEKTSIVSENNETVIKTNEKADEISDVPIIPNTKENNTTETEESVDNSKTIECEQEQKCAISDNENVDSPKKSNDSLNNLISKEMNISQTDRFSPDSSECKSVDFNRGFMVQTVQPSVKKKGKNKKIGQERRRHFRKTKQISSEKHDNLLKNEENVQEVLNTSSPISNPDHSIGPNLLQENEPEVLEAKDIPTEMSELSGEIAVLEHSANQTNIESVNDSLQKSEINSESKSGITSSDIVGSIETLGIAHSQIVARELSENKTPVLDDEEPIILEEKVIAENVDKSILTDSEDELPLVVLKNKSKFEKNARDIKVDIPSEQLVNIDDVQTHEKPRDSLKELVIDTEEDKKINIGKTIQVADNISSPLNKLITGELPFSTEPEKEKDPNIDSSLCESEVTDVKDSLLSSPKISKTKKNIIRRSPRKLIVRSSTIVKKIKCIKSKKSKNSVKTKLGVNFSEEVEDLGEKLKDAPAVEEDVAKDLNADVNHSVDSSNAIPEEKGLGTNETEEENVVVNELQQSMNDSKDEKILVETSPVPILRVTKIKSRKKSKNREDAVKTKLILKLPKIILKEPILKIKSSDNLLENYDKKNEETGVIINLNMEDKPCSSNDFTKLIESTIRTNEPTSGITLKLKSRNKKKGSKHKKKMKNTNENVCSDDKTVEGSNVIFNPSEASIMFPDLSTPSDAITINDTYSMPLFIASDDFKEKKHDVFSTVLEESVENFSMDEKCILESSNISPRKGTRKKKKVMNKQNNFDLFIPTTVIDSNLPEIDKSIVSSIGSDVGEKKQSVEPETFEITEVPDVLESETNILPSSEYSLQQFENMETNSRKKSKTRAKKYKSKNIVESSNSLQSEMESDILDESISKSLSSEDNYLNKKEESNILSDQDGAQTDSSKTEKVQEPAKAILRPSRITGKRKSKLDSSENSIEKPLVEMPLQQDEHLNKGILPIEESKIQENDEVDKSLEPKDSRTINLQNNVEETPESIVTKPARSLRSTLKITYKQSNIFALQIESEEVADLKKTDNSKSILSNNLVEMENSDLIIGINRKQETSDCFEKDIDKKEEIPRENGEMNNKCQGKQSNNDIHDPSVKESSSEIVPHIFYEIGGTSEKKKLNYRRSKKIRKTRSTSKSEDINDLLKDLEENINRAPNDNGKIISDSENLVTVDNIQENDTNHLIETSEETDNICQNIDNHIKANRKEKKTNLRLDSVDLKIIIPEKDPSSNLQEKEDLNISTSQKTLITNNERSNELEIEDDFTINNEDSESPKKLNKTKKSRKERIQKHLPPCDDVEKSNAKFDNIQLVGKSNISEFNDNPQVDSPKVKDAFEFEDDLIPIEKLSPQFKRRYFKDPKIPFDDDNESPISKNIGSEIDKTPSKRKSKEKLVRNLEKAKEFSLDSSHVRKHRNAKTKALENINALEKKIDQSLDIEPQQEDGEEKESISLFKRRKDSKRNEIIEKHANQILSDKSREVKTVEIVEIGDIITPRKSRLAKAKAIENIKILEKRPDDILDEETNVSEDIRIEIAPSIIKESAEVTFSYPSKDWTKLLEENPEAPIDNLENNDSENVHKNNGDIVNNTFLLEENIDYSINIDSSEKLVNDVSVSDTKKRKNSRNNPKPNISDLLQEKEISTVENTRRRKNRFKLSESIDETNNSSEIAQKYSDTDIISEISGDELLMHEEIEPIDKKDSETAFSSLKEKVNDTVFQNDISGNRKSRLAKSKALENINDLKKIDVDLPSDIDDIKYLAKTEKNTKTKYKLDNLDNKSNLTDISGIVKAAIESIPHEKSKRKNKKQLDKNIPGYSLEEKIVNAADCYDINKIDDDPEEPVLFTLHKNKNIQTKEMNTLNIQTTEKTQSQGEKVENSDLKSSRKGKIAKDKTLENVPVVSDNKSDFLNSLDTSLEATIVEISSILKSEIKPSLDKKILDDEYSKCITADLVPSEFDKSDVTVETSNETWLKEHKSEKTDVLRESEIEMEQLQECAQKKRCSKDMPEDERTRSEKNPKLEGDEAEEPENKRRSRRACKVNTYNENELAEAIFLQAAADKEKEKSRRKKENLEQNKTSTNEKKMNSDELFDLLKATATENFNLPKPGEETSPDDKIDGIKDFTDDNFDDVFDDILKKSQELFKGKSFNQEKSDEPCRYDDSSNTSNFNSSHSRTVGKPTPVLENEEGNDTNKSDPSLDNLYCDICKKSFKRIDNLVKHRSTLTHISKLSEIEAKQAENKLRETLEDYDDSSKSNNMNEYVRKTNESDSLYSYPPTPGNDALKIAEIITGAFEKPAINSDNFSEIVPPVSNYRRYKSLGERKSFESDQGSSNISENLESNIYGPHITNNAGVILEKQITLLQNIIENRGLEYIDDISMSSYHSLENSNHRDSPVSIISSKLDDSNNLIFPQNNLTSSVHRDESENFLKPPQIEDVSEDSVNLKIAEDVKARKVLNRDEELFLECCSLLKSSSEVSNFSKKSNRTSALTNVALKMSDEPDMFESKNLVDKVNEESTDYSRMATPLGDSFGDTSDSNTISSNWGMNKDEQIDKKEGNYFNFRHDQSGQTEGMSSNSTRFKKLVSRAIKMPFRNVSKIIKSRKHSSSESSIPDEKDFASDSSSKMPTKGALKVFEGLKVSIPTEELNLAEVLNNSPPIKKVDTSNLVETHLEKQFLSPKTPRSARKSKPVKNKQQIDDRFIFKVKKKSTLKDDEKTKYSQETSDKISDVYDFEETQDNTDVFAKPDFKTFRTKEPEDKTDIVENNSEGQTLSSSSSSTTSNSKKPKTNECITKKKHMIMGRIFKNALKPKMDEEIRDIPIIDHNELVENYVLSCNSKVEEEFKRPKMTEEEMNYLFDKLLDTSGGTTRKQSIQNKIEAKTSGMKKKLKTKCKKRQRSNSDSTDDEFGLNKIVRKRPNRKNAKEEDNSINLEQELKECIGVASRKSQRKCTSGKQNVLVEYWSSDESAFEAFLENHLQELSETTEIPVPKTEENCQKVEKVDTIRRPSAGDKDTKIKSKVKDASIKKKSIAKENSTSPDSQELSAQSHRRKRTAAHPLYHWSSSSEDEMQDLIEVKSIRDDPDDEYDEDRPVQHGWIVGDSPKKLVTMLAQAKGKKTEPESSVKEQGKKKNSNS